MRVLFAHDLPTITPSQKRKLAAISALLEEQLTRVLANSFEIVIRDGKMINDHLFDPEDPVLSNEQNKLVSPSRVTCSDST